MASEHSKMASLDKLPNEFLWLLPLDYPSALNLAATNKHFRYVIDPLKVVSHKDKAIFLRRAEKFRRYIFLFERGYACFHCYRIKSPYEFTSSNIYGRLGEGRGMGFERKCIKCCRSLDQQSEQKISSGP